MTVFTVGRVLLLAGLVLAALGAGVVLMSALGIDKVPGTFVWRRGGLTLMPPSVLWSSSGCC